VKLRERIEICIDWHATGKKALHVDFVEDKVIDVSLQNILIQLPLWVTADHQIKEILHD
jgi:hypothetical protein